MPLKICYINLTFDLEEFDIPEEFGQKVSFSDQMLYSVMGVERLLILLEKYEIKATFFTTGNFALHNAELMQRIAAKHEIASHGMYHAIDYEFKDEDLLKSKHTIEEISGQKVTGFRMPRLQPFSLDSLRMSGYRYDSSLNPTFLPGRYNHLNQNANPHLKQGIIELPCSTTPALRFPLFWLAFKNLPLWFYKPLCKLTLRHRKNLMLYFHPWEFADIQSFKLPRYIKAQDGEVLIKKLEMLVLYFKKQNVRFVTCSEFCEQLEISVTN